MTHPAGQVAMKVPRKLRREEGVPIWRRVLLLWWGCVFFIACAAVASNKPKGTCYMAPTLRSSMADNLYSMIVYRVGSEAHPVLKKKKKKRETTRRHTMYYSSQVENIGAAPGRRSPCSSTWFVILTLRSDGSQSRRRSRWQSLTS